MSSQDIGTLRTRLSWEDEGSTRGLRGFRDDLRGLRSEMNAARSGSREYTQSLTGLRQQSDILSRQLRTQQERVEKLRRRYEESKRVKGEDAQQTRNLANQYNNAVAEMNRTEQQLENVNDAIDRQTNHWRRLGDNMTNTGQRMQSLGRDMSEFGKSYSMKVTAPIVAGGVAVFKAASDYESAFAGVRKTVDMTEAEFASLSNSIREMAKVGPSSATELASIAEAAGQLGIANENILAFTSTMSDLGVATNMSSDEAATALARFANITKMNQKDFDRLGSSIVALGNNFATTEREIVEMSMRLAGAGAQVGMSEADILALATALSSVGIEAEMGGSAISRVMVNMQVATSTGFTKVKELLDSTGMSIRDLQMMASHSGKAFGHLAEDLGMTKTELSNLLDAGVDLENFSKIAGMTGEEFKKAFEQDAIGALGAFIEGLANAEQAGDSAINMLQEMGITEIRLRDSLLRAGGASKLFADAVKLSSNAWDENNALTKEAEERYKTTASQMQILWNRIKDVGISLGGALIPAVLDAIDAAEPLIKQIESGAKAFAEMDKEQQQTILKMISLVAAVGPAAIVVGNLTTGIGGLVKIGGSLASILGTAGGAGLLARLGSFVPVIGPAIGVVGALGFGIYSLMQNSEEYHKVNYKVIEQMSEEIEATDQLIEQYENLKNKNALTTEEMLRYMDILTELKDARSEEAIKALTDEQTALLEKSGLTNEEMESFLGLNEEIIKQAPTTVQAISEEGNAFAENLEALKQLNAEKRQELLITAERELTKALENETRLLSEQERIVAEINKLNGEISESNSIRIEKSKELLEEEKKLKEIESEILKLASETSAEAEEKRRLLQMQEYEQGLIVATLEQEIKKLDKSYEKQKKKLDTKNADLDVTKEELKKIEQLKSEYEALILSQAGLTSEKGKGLGVINEQLGINKKQKQELDELVRKNPQLTAEYEEQNKKLNEQHRKLEEAKRKLEDMNTLASKPISKDINVKTNPSVDELNQKLSSTLNRTVNVFPHNKGPQLSAYAEGTSFHPGGPALVGEEGFELAKLGNRWSMLGFGISDLPRGTQVFTHDESKKIIQALNRMPAYSSGISPNGEVDRLVNRLNSTPPIQIQPAPVILEGQVIGEVVFDVVDGMQFNRTTMNAMVKGLKL